MPKIIKPLSEIQCRNAKPKDKDYKLSDGGGMFLLVKINGSKWWRLNYRFDEKQKTLSLGVYPETSLLKAREEREKLRKLIKDDIDPSNDRKQISSKKSNLFSDVAKQWLEHHEHQIEGWHNAKHGYLDNHVNPVIGKFPIAEIAASDIIRIGKRLEDAGKLETIRKTLICVNQIFKFALGQGYIKHNVNGDIDRRNIFKKAPVKHYPVIIEYKALGRLLRDIDHYHGHIIVRYALQLAPHVFLRPGNIRFAEWNEINFETAIWRINSNKMKNAKPHIVPLSKQVLQILKDLFELTGHGKYLFPSMRSSSRPISENTLVNALRNIGYSKEELVAHSFRGIASTLLHENIPNHTIHTDAIERQLAHSEGNAVKASYNHAEYLEERTKLMQWWSDFLEKLKNSTTIPKN